MWECIECEQSAFVQGAVDGRGRQSPDFLCFACGVHHASHELETCGRCGRLILFERGVCCDCAEDLMDRA